jgi:hypothetical protein
VPFSTFWGIPFDPETGHVAGEEFRMTHHDSPGRTVTAAAAPELGVSSTWLAVPITGSKGSVWLLDGVSRYRASGSWSPAARAGERYETFWSNSHSR